MRNLKKFFVYQKNTSKILFLGALALIQVSAFSCVTVNVNFPEGAVQKATDDYVKELYREKNETSSIFWIHFTDVALNFGRNFSFIREAQANAEFNVNTPEAIKLQGKLKKRVSKIKKYKEKGALGEDNQGLLVLKKPEKLKKLLLKQVTKTVEDENKDREELYEEVATANKLSATFKVKLRTSFARSFQSESPSGTWIQDDAGNWSQKP